MIRSMTGYGKHLEEAGSGKKFTIEIRSLNSKSFDLNLRIPYLYKEKELELRAELAKQIERGKVDVSIFVESTQGAAPAQINKVLAKQYYKELQQVSEELKAPHSDLLRLVMSMPEVIVKSEKESNELDEKQWKTIKEAVQKAIRSFQKFRTDEGKILEKEFKKRVENIRKLLKEIGNSDSKRIKNIRNRITKNIEDAIDKEKIDANRLEQELIYYIEKLDITEEKLRLKTHLDYFLTTMQEESNGRKLVFISQEIGREVNTIGSKANDAGIQTLVVQMKDELEKIKEQLLNVL